MKIAVIHEWLTSYAGSERVLEQILVCFPDADVFSIVDFIAQGEREFIQRKDVSTSFVQNLPFAKSKYRAYLPLMPLAVEQFDLSKYDLIISSSHAVAKGVITGPNQLHISYVHSPIRYAWDLQHQYLNESGLNVGLKGWIARWLLHRIRMWDTRTANGVDLFIANSNFISKRIRKVYRRNSVVIYPPVDIHAFKFSGQKEKFYLAASRMVPYKKMDLIIAAFNAMPEKKLIVIGSGPDYAKLKSKQSPNIVFLGYQPYEVLQDHMQRAQAFIFAALEDFGIAPLEAQACGTPVIAYGQGGVLETIRGLDDPIPTGVLYAEQTAAAIQNAVVLFESQAGRISPRACRENALRFAPERFREEIRSVVGKEWAAFHSGVERSGETS